MIGVIYVIDTKQSQVKNMRFDAIQTIKDRLTMVDVVERYGFEPNRAMFICCPFHDEKTPSMKIYAGEKGYTCFGCGDSGDVISFVQKLFKLPFVDVLKKIDIDFGLKIYGNHTFEELRQSHYKQKQMQAERERKEREKEQANNEYWAVFDEWKRLQDNMIKYAPKTIDEELHPLFVEAVQKLANQEYMLDCADIRRRNL